MLITNFTSFSVGLSTQMSLSYHLNGRPKKLVTCVRKSDIVAFFIRGSIIRSGSSSTKRLFFHISILSELCVAHNFVDPSSGLVMEIH